MLSFFSWLSNSPPYPAFKYVESCVDLPETNRSEKKVNLHRKPLWCRPLGYGQGRDRKENEVFVITYWKHDLTTKLNDYIQLTFSDHCFYTSHCPLKDKRSEGWLTSSLLPCLWPTLHLLAALKNTHLAFAAFWLYICPPKDSNFL